MTATMTIDDSQEDSRNNNDGVLDPDDTPDQRSTKTARTMKMIHDDDCQDKQPLPSMMDDTL